MKYIGLTISLQFKLNMTGASSKTLYIADLYKQTGQFIPGVLFPASVFIGTLSFAFVTRMHRQCVCNARMMFLYLRHNSYYVCAESPILAADVSPSLSQPVRQRRTRRIMEPKLKYSLVRVCNANAPAVRL